MEKRIRVSIILIGALSVILTACGITYIFQGAIRNRSISHVKTYGELIKESYKYVMNEGEISDSELLNSYSEEDLRVTLISAEGKVIYESETPTTLGIDNHSDRPEVIDALENGKGESLRESSTLGYEMYYYAQKMEDGNILRISKEVSDMIGAFLTALPIVSAVSLVIMIMAFLISVFLTRKIVGTITNIANRLDEVDEYNVYRELRPFIINIKEQQKKKSEIEKMKQDFIANVSHELKTPLTSISGYAEMIETGIARDEDIKSFAGKIHHESGRLITLIGDIIKLSEINELSSFENRVFKNINLCEIVTETINALRFYASKMEVSFEWRGEECYVFGNKGMLEELVYNICDNAIRYNKTGGKIYVSLRNEGLPSKVSLKIKDTGIGIPEKYYDRIFERFYRVDKSRSKETGGTGLGLAIVKHIAILHKAVITVESQENEGTEIKILFGKLDI